MYNMRNSWELFYYMYDMYLWAIFMRTLPLFMYAMIDLIYSRQLFTQRWTVVPNLFELQVTLLHRISTCYVLQRIRHFSEHIPTIFAMNEKFL